MNDLFSRWNHYFLRYCVGTIVGAVIIMFLADNDVGFHAHHLKYLLHKTDDGKIELGGSAIAILAALGFAYCYIASAPGTVFHVARGLFYQRKTSWLPKNLPLILISVPLLVICPILSYPPVFLVEMSLKDAIMIFMGLGVGVFIFCLQCVLLICVFADFGRIRLFYRDLTSMRSGLQNINNVDHYCKSYRDLREHGNAFEIVIMEIALAVTLVFFKSFFVLVLALWVLPAAFCWIIGTMLEFQIPIERDAISLLARRIWESEGQPMGRDEDFWKEAERQIRDMHKKD